MAWTTPATYTVGQVLTAANLNTYLRDNMSWVGVDAPNCRVFNSAAISTTSGATTLLTYDSERYDVGAMHSTSTNTGRLTVPSGGAGKYRATLHTSFAASATGVRYSFIRLNGSTVIARDIRAAVSGDTTDVAITAIYVMSVGDYFDSAVIQTSGGGVNIVATAANSPEFSAEWVRI
jgi:type IV secretory pathway VirB6-like protein